MRAIIFQKNNILLVRSNKGDYKFPGGGVEGNESHSECLIRELAEETGYINCSIKDKLGSVIEKKLDEFDNNALFQMTSHYYLCELINDERIAQQLDNYELAQEFTPEWVSINDAIGQNEKVMNSLGSEKNSWIKREIFVLKELKNKLRL
ncbi:NUDIX hydrolase [Psychrobacillus sp. OK028]|uniref:NUDIX hydrolase n=1 Tax=Psychrobacillus sp. OK028 TaxID=1884359 RepID=UPI0021105CC5|nr:NUDIX domain-containing protein [Psychrobacillus sp. OK028]